MTKYYLGKVREVKDRLTYEIRIDIPGVVEDKPAFPLRGEVDEPMIGDYVVLREIDPVYGSMYLYSKLKEDEYIGFRSNGKLIDITPDHITMKVYKRNSDTDAREDDFDGFETKITMNADGTMEIESKSSMTIKSPNITIKGPGVLTCKGTVIPSSEGGPFCAVKVAPPPGTPMITGDKIILE